MSKRKVPMLSKSRFLAGLQCPLRLWHECYNREFASEVSSVKQAVFDTGHEVGRLATQLYPEGVLIEEDHLPEFHGSFSLKSALPAILPEMSYENLEIQEGQLASLEYLKMIDSTTPTEEKKKIKRDLLTYCGHDTLAMLKIREELISIF